MKIKPASEQLKIKKSNDTLMETEEIFNRFMEHNPIYVFFKDEHSRYLRLSKNYEQILGMPVDEIIGKTLDEVLPFDPAKGFIAEDKRVFKEGKPIRVEEEFNGRFYEIIKFPIFFKDKPKYFAGYAIDITESKHTEEALKISEARYRSLFETTQDGILVLDAETGQILDINPFAIEMLGYSREDFLGKKIWEINAFKDIGAAKAIFGELQTQGYVRYEDIPLEKKDGKPIEVEFVTNVTMINHHKVILCNIHDITERNFIAEALQKARNELEQRVQERTAELQAALSKIKAMKEQLEAENIYLRDEIELKSGYSDIIGASDPIKYVLYRVRQVAQTKTSILLTGETGTGKGIFARLIHRESDRRDKPFVNVNCAGLPANLIESELFGREKGAFTGSTARQMGRFELANNGTIFLDEIGELPLELQAKLLRVIEDEEFERLGSPHTVKVDVRIIASTNRLLEDEIKKGLFRQDLYYRLSVFPITIPPLRQRKDDIPLLVEFFTESFSKRHNKSIKRIPVNIMKNLENYSWPGNIRELKNIIERAVIVSDGSQLQLAEHIIVSPVAPALEDVSKGSIEGHTQSLVELEREHILKALEETGWKVEGPGGAAQRLEMNPSTMRARMRKLGITRPGVR